MTSVFFLGKALVNRLQTWCDRLQ